MAFTPEDERKAQARIRVKNYVRSIAFVQNVWSGRGDAVDSDCDEAKRIEALEGAVNELHRILSDLRERHNWHARRISEIERAPFFLRETDPGEVEGIRRKIREFRNTVSRFIYPPAKQSQGSIANSRHSPHSLRKHARLQKLMADVSVPVGANGDRVLIDMTSTLDWDSTTGIQRVVREFSRAGAQFGMIPVFLDNGQVYGYDFLQQSVVPMAVKSGDFFFWADASWEYSDLVSKIMTQVSGVGGQNIFMLYDIIPLQLPEVCGVDLPQIFAEWMHGCVMRSDGVICISKAVADEFSEYAENHSMNLKQLGWSHLGWNVPAHATGKISADVERLPCGDRPFFVSVGTVEPRKGYSIALDAFDDLWDSGIDADYVIVGRYGWSQETIRNRILKHPQFGKRLFWFNNASDADLEHVYKNARALIMATVAEGFGLPLAEAARFGLPALVSDLEVLREIAGDQAEYFEVANSEQLADKIKLALVEPKKCPKINIDNWEKAAVRTLQMIRTGAYQKISRADIRACDSRNSATDSVDLRQRSK